MRLLHLSSCLLLLCSGGALANTAGDEGPPAGEVADADAHEVTPDPPSAEPPPAHDEHTREQVDAQTIVPPVLVEAITVEHPLPVDEARALGPARVVVLLTVGVDGAVSDLGVVEEASHPDPRLREAALAAARRARFQPATRGGEALAVRLPFEIAFQPPPEAALPVLDGITLDAAHDLGDESATRPLDLVGLGQSVAVGGALVLGASLLFTTFSGVTALDDAARQEELAKTAAETAAAKSSHAFGTLMLIPFAGPFLAIPSSPDASTTLFAALGGAAHVAGAALLATGGALLLTPLLLESDAVVEPAE